ncbi:MULTISPECIES: hypothetical protein [Moorena]|uniref:hypothetical protein n=1 Tax=Moorena TaxID=1155738 RepID=UPI00117C6405|nr:MULTISPECIES: hypothetical protein [Moorena]NEP32380.1 hypothetical protein [Moorena sp. SIO3B2]NEP64025.1 hypothetical protein [Moorena sp. SIO3A5]NEQ10214.1 hypothetical protein [Moorena sp. SIO4E2]NER91900.1 hypothetical protein [Moorena sp. SIO3A2]NES40948.1 hypothetical protein [Moorena sp. SIO2C4]
MRSRSVTKGQSRLAVGHATRTRSVGNAYSVTKGQSHGTAAAKSGNNQAHPITRCSAVAQPENTGSRVLYLTLFSLQALEY